MASVNISWSVLDNYASGARALGDQTASAIAQSLAAIDVTDREMVEDLVTAACEAASQAGSDYATVFYRGLSILQTGEDVDFTAMSPYDRRATLVAIRGIYNQAEGEDGELDEGMVRERLVQRVQFEANRATKVGVWRAGQNDGRDVRYARVPTGTETCAWCLMTAGLGYWYMTEEAASHTHRSCDCVVVPSIGRGDVVIDGYDSTVYRDMWRNANEMRANGDLPKEWSDHIARERARHRELGLPYRDDTNGTLYVMRKLHGLK